MTALLRHLSPIWTAWSGPRWWRNSLRSATWPRSAFQSSPEAVRWR